MLIFNSPNIILEFPVQSKQANYLQEECFTSAYSQFSHPHRFVSDEATDYFDKICDNVPNPKGITGASQIGNFKLLIKSYLKT